MRPFIFSYCFCTLGARSSSGKDESFRQTSLQTFGETSPAVPLVQSKMAFKKSKAAASPRKDGDSHSFLHSLVNSFIFVHPILKSIQIDVLQGGPSRLPQILLRFLL